MTTIRAALARINDRLDETDTGTVLVCVALFLAAFLAALVWGVDRVVDVILAAGIAAVAWYAGAVRARADRASDDADVARGKAEAIEEHLAGVESPTRGRHASHVPTPFPRRPTPVELP